MSPADEARVQEVFRRESRSLLQYARDAALYAAGADRKLRDDVIRVAGEEAAAIRGFGEFLAANRVVLPYLGSYPVVFTDLNFVSVRFMLPKLVEEQKRDLAALEADAATLTDPAAQSTVLHLAELHRRHLAELESLG
jgi:hypothetical protein